MLATTDPQRTETYRIAGATLFGALAVIVAALLFEHVGGLPPCPLCLEQRYAYYAAIPALFVAMALIAEKPQLAAVILALVAAAFAANVVLGTYHAGAEWKLWAGPETCAGTQPLPTSPADLLAGLDRPAVRCDEAAWRFAGLSLAGWNVLASLLLAIGAARASYLALSAR